MTKKEFKKWVDKTVREYNADFKVLCLYRGETGEIIDENKIIVLDTKTGKTGMARCHKDDKFILETGLAIAYARLRGIEVPKVEEEPKFERVEEGRKYYTVVLGSFDKISVKEYTERHMDFNESAFENNNYFHTKERATKVADKINFLLKLERLRDTYCPDYQPDWNGNVKYYVVYEHCNNIFEVSSCIYLDNNSQVYFPSREIAQKVCDELNKELKMPF